MKYIEIEEIKVSTQLGSDISACIAEAIKLALDHKTNVVLSINDREYNVNIAEVLDTVR